MVKICVHLWFLKINTEKWNYLIKAYENILRLNTCYQVSLRLFQYIVLAAVSVRVSFSPCLQSQFLIYFFF